MPTPRKKNLPPRRTMRRAAIVALLAGEPVCTTCTGWGTLEDHAACRTCNGQGVSSSIAAILAPARDLFRRA